MRYFAFTVLAASALSCAAPVFGQDLFSSTNSTVHSYNYIEIQYLPDVEATPPILASAVLDVAENLSLKAEYFTQDYGDISGLLEDPEALGIEITAEADSYSVGALYHRPLPNIAQSDWIAGVMFGRVALRVEAPQFGVGVSEGISFREFYAGIRRTLLPQLEGEVTLNLYRDRFENTTTADVKVVYRLHERFDIALAGNELGETNILGIGLRYAW